MNDAESETIYMSHRDTDPQDRDFSEFRSAEQRRNDSGTTWRWGVGVVLSVLVAIGGILIFLLAPITGDIRALRDVQTHHSEEIMGMKTEIDMGRGQRAELLETIKDLKDQVKNLADAVVDLKIQISVRGGRPSAHGVYPYSPGGIQ